MRGKKQTITSDQRAYYRLWKLIQEDHQMGDRMVDNRYSYLLSGIALDLIGRTIIHKASVAGMDFNAIAGPSMGAEPIVSSVLVKYPYDGYEGAIYRTDPKYHGTAKRVESSMIESRRLLVVDDTVKTGNTLIAACTSFMNAGHEIAGIVVLLDTELVTSHPTNVLGMIEENFRCRAVSIFKESDFGPSAECPYLPAVQPAGPHFDDDIGLAAGMLSDH